MVVNVSSVKLLNQEWTLLGTLTTFFFLDKSGFCDIMLLKELLRETLEAAGDHSDLVGDSFYFCHIIKCYSVFFSRSNCVNPNFSVQWYATFGVPSLFKSSGLTFFGWNSLSYVLTSANKSDILFIESVPGIREIAELLFVFLAYPSPADSIFMPCKWYAFLRCFFPSGIIFLLTKQNFVI